MNVPKVLTEVFQNFDKTLLTQTILITYKVG